MGDARLGPGLYPQLESLDPPTVGLNPNSSEEFEVPIFRFLCSARGSGVSASASPPQAATPRAPEEPHVQSCHTVCKLREEKPPAPP